jgi:hypothetical protein
MRRAARGMEVVRSHRRDTDALRQAADLLDELAAAGKFCEVAGVDEGVPVVRPPLKVTDRWRSSLTCPRPWRGWCRWSGRRSFGLDEDRPDGSQPMTVVWEGASSYRG